ncbi:MAG: hypothetical protein OER88_14405, partial [Planctomycetota bacterium]|nr:hypothetical protein [Planctomycetota bacterium]
MSALRVVMTAALLAVLWVAPAAGDGHEGAAEPDSAAATADASDAEAKPAPPKKKRKKKAPLTVEQKQKLRRNFAINEERKKLQRKYPLRSRTGRLHL